MRAGVASIYWARKLAPQDFDWRQDAYEFVDEIPAIDLLFGTDRIRLALENGATIPEVMNLLEDGRTAFMERRRPHLIYGGAAA